MSCKCVIFLTVLLSNDDQPSKKNISDSPPLLALGCQWGDTKSTSKSFYLTTLSSLYFCYNELEIYANLFYLSRFPKRYDLRNYISFSRLAL